MKLYELNNLYFRRSGFIAESPNAHIIGNKVQVTKVIVKFKLYDMKYNILNVNNNENILFEII
jgi:hypothetical protein